MFFWILRRFIIFFIPLIKNFRKIPGEAGNVPLVKNIYLFIHIDTNNSGLKVPSHYYAEPKCSSGSYIWMNHSLPRTWKISLITLQIFSLSCKVSKVIKFETLKIIELFQKCNNSLEFQLLNFIVEILINYNGMNNKTQVYNSFIHFNTAVYLNI